MDRSRLIHWNLLLLGVATLLLVASCGPEAPSRADRATFEPTRPQPTSAAVPAAEQGDDPRAIGDPNAPITVVEYSDFQ